MPGYNTNRFKKRKKKIYYIKLSLFGVLLLSFFVGGLFLLRHSSINVSKVSVGNTVFANSNSIEDLIFEVLKKDILFFIPKSNFLFIPESEIEEKIKDKFPSVSSIDFDLKGLNKLNVDVKEYGPEILWCKQENDCLFVNERGRAFMNEPIIHSYNDLIRFYGADPNTQKGWDVIDGEFLNSLLQLSENIKNLELKVKNIDNLGEDVYSLETDSGFNILINKADDLEDSFEHLKVIFEKNAIDVSNLNTIDYIDLRFGNKIFYKIKEE